MRWLANFAMGGRSRAVLVAAASAILALAAPPVTAPLSYLGGAVIALVTLRFGIREGLVTLVAAALATAALGYLALGQAQSVVLATLFLWVPAWLLAQVLRSSAALARAMQGAALLGIVALLGVYLVYGDPAPRWREVLEPVMMPLLEQAGIATAPDLWVKRAAGMMTGVLAGATVLGLILTLFLARGWQAMLYNPGGFRAEFYRLRFTPASGWLTLGLVVLAQLGTGLPAMVAMQSAIVLLVLYLVAGMALVHGTVGLLQAKSAWLVAVYVLLLLAPPQIMLLLTMAGFWDSWFDFRGRIGTARAGRS